MKFLLLLTLCGQPQLVEWSDGKQIYFMQWQDVPEDLKKEIRRVKKNKTQQIEVYPGSCA